MTIQFIFVGAKKDNLKKDHANWFESENKIFCFFFVEKCSKKGGA